MHMAQLNMVSYTNPSPTLPIDTRTMSNGRADRPQLADAARNIKLETFRYTSAKAQRRRLAADDRGHRCIAIRMEAVDR